MTACVNIDEQIIEQLKTYDRLLVLRACRTLIQLGGSGNLSVDLFDRMKYFWFHVGNTLVVFVCERKRTNVIYIRQYKMNTQIFSYNCALQQIEISDPLHEDFVIKNPEHLIATFKQAVK